MIEAIIFLGAVVFLFISIFLATVFLVSFFDEFRKQRDQ
jgi:hypothetical protein